MDISKDAMPQAEESQESLFSQLGKYVTFKSGNEYFGIKIEYVNEIIVLQEITVIPESVDYITSPTPAKRAASNTLSFTSSCESPRLRGPKPISALTVSSKS